MMFRQAARSFPHDIIQAARLEGLSEIRIFFYHVPANYEVYLRRSHDSNFHECLE